jgi:ubiquinone/menaquinone biosynthesis C-methylase UbiE
VSGGRRATKRVIAAFYSGLAARLYDRLIARGTLRLLGGGIERHIAEQGRRAVAHAGASPILDMPVGTGIFTLGMARAHPGLVVGVDLAAGMVTQARRAARAAAVARLAVVQADAHRLPFRRDAFAAVTCWNGLPAMPGRSLALRELARVLRPSGRLFLAAVALRLGAIVGPRAARRLPTLLVSQWEIRDAVLGAGLFVDGTLTDRLAILMEATKPPA